MQIKNYKQCIQTTKHIFCWGGGYKSVELKLWGLVYKSLSPSLQV